MTNCVFIAVYSIYRELWWSGGFRSHLFVIPCMNLLLLGRELASGKMYHLKKKPNMVLVEDHSRAVTFPPLVFILPLVSDTNAAESCGNSEPKEQRHEASTVEVLVWSNWRVTAQRCAGPDRQGKRWQFICVCRGPSFSIWLQPLYTSKAFVCQVQ